MLDGHIHIERGEYTLEWISEFVDNAVKNNIDEIWLLEHCYRYKEFVPMYDSVCAYSDYISDWFHRNAGALELVDYLNVIKSVRNVKFPIKIKFGLEVCYFKEFENLVTDITKNLDLDFILGSVHFVDDFAFDHKAEHWEGIDVDNMYKRYFEISLDLINSGIYSGIAHPDCVKLFGHTPTFSCNTYYEQMAKALHNKSMYIEQSSGIYRRCPHTAELGMNEKMLLYMKKHNVRIVTVSDAHCPEDVGSYISELNELINKN